MAEYRAKLDTWRHEVSHNVLTGMVSEDKRKRLPEGKRISTSTLLSSPDDLAEGAVAVTKTGSYLLGRKG